MSLEHNSNLNPKANPDQVDMRAMAVEMVGKAHAELIEAQRAKATEPIPKAPVEPTVSHRFRSVSDVLATKDIGDCDHKEKLRLFARSLQCNFQSGCSGNAIAADYAKSIGQETVAKTMQAGVLADGGFMLAPEFSQAIIEEMTPRSTVLAHNPVEVTMPEGGLTLPFEDDGADASYVGEATEQNADDITGGQLQAVPRKLITIIGASNDLLRGRPGSGEQFILDSIFRGMVTKLDATLLRSDGTQNRPTGLLYHAAAANKFNASATVNLTNVTKNLLNLQFLLEDQNVNLDMDRAAYTVSARTKTFLRSLRTGGGDDGAKAFPEMDRGELSGLPFNSTSQIPNNLGSGTDESEIYCAAYGRLVFAVNEEMLVDVFPGGSFKNSSGTTVSGISADLTTVRVIQKHDFLATQRGKEIAIMEDVIWTLT